jgi:four helix bundle protein
VMPISVSSDGTGILPTHAVSTPLDRFSPADHTAKIFPSGEIAYPNVSVGLNASSGRVEIILVSTRRSGSATGYSPLFAAYASAAIFTIRRSPRTFAARASLRILKKFIVTTPKSVAMIVSAIRSSITVKAFRVFMVNGIIAWRDQGQGARDKGEWRENCWGRGTRGQGQGARVKGPGSRGQGQGARVKGPGGGESVHQKERGTALSEGFKDLIAWQKGYELLLGVYKITKEFPRNEMFGLTSQMRRAAVSVVGNIAEGYERIHRKEYVYFLSVAKGSLGELEAYLMLANDLGYVNADGYKGIDEKRRETARILMGLMRSLRGQDKGQGSRGQGEGEAKRRCE